jgi:GTP-binding protein
MAKKAQISIVGRPNVGKSTLVNRLAGKRVCIVGEEAGITRDRNYIDCEWDGRELTVVDTGGLSFDGEDAFSADIYTQTMAGINESDAVIFLVDVSSGITKDDDRIAQILRRESKAPVYVAVNKVDSHEREQLIYEFYKLGFDELYPISALHGSQGLSSMLSKIVADINASVRGPATDGEIIRVAFVGRPNVGKSSLFNKLTGSDRSIVSDISGTTRDAVNMRLTRHGHQFELVDTAGLRRKSKVINEVERYSVIRSTYSIAAADVVVLIIDATEPEIVTDQDQKIASLINERGRACVVLINKWDIFEDKQEHELLAKYKEQLDFKLRFIDYAQREYISALTGQRTDKLWQMIIDANAQHKKRVNTSTLNQILSDILTYHPSPIVKQKAVKIKYITQIGAAPPQFLCFANHPELVPESYVRFLEGQFRQYFGFQGTPIVIKFKQQDE